MQIKKRGGCFPSINIALATFWNCQSPQAKAQKALFLLSAFNKQVKLHYRSKTLYIPLDLQPCAAQ